jgi:HD superfamily phosphohydrolase
MAKSQPGKLFPLDTSSPSALASKQKKKARHPKAERQELFLPVSGFVWFYPEEIQIINHAAFQRLSRINQLGQAYLVFRGATHRRFEHSLGAVHIVQRMITAVSRNSDKALHNGSPLGTPLSDCEERFVRLGALLHDIGHLAAGHTLEDELGLIGAHDADKRLSRVFNERSFDPERPGSFGSLVDSLYEEYVPTGLKGKISPTNILRMLIRKLPMKPSERPGSKIYDEDNDDFKEAYKVLSESSEIRLNICSNMVGNTICADLLDYLFRDWYHVGKPRTFDDRILQYMEIRSKNAAEEQEKENNTPPSATDKFVVALGRSPKIRTDGVSAILELLEWRYQLAETVLFHRTKVAAAGMLDRALFELWDEENDEDKIIEAVLTLSDEQLIDDSIRIAKNKGESSDRSAQLKAKVAAQNLNRIKHRNLFAELKTWGVDNIAKNLREQIRNTYGAASLVPKNAAAARTQALRELETDFKMAPGSLAMYCTEMKPKIAEVSISVEGVIKTLADYEDDEDDPLSGGHLGAQIKRFKRLWRVHFFIERNEKKRLQDAGLLGTLNHAIEALVLGNCDDPKSTARDIAHALSGRPEAGWHGAKVLDLPAEAARSDENWGNVRGYPYGAPSIRAFLATGVTAEK